MNADIVWLAIQRANKEANQSQAIRDKIVEVQLITHFY